MANGDLLGNAVPRICDAEGYAVILRWTARVVVVVVVDRWVNTDYQF